MKLSVAWQKPRPPEGYDTMMNKKEQAQYAEMQQLLRLKGALRATSPVPYDVPIPDQGSSELITGFLPTGGVDDWSTVDVACSSNVHHSIGRTDKTGSQHARSLYSTRLLALRALRYETEQASARRLARVDRMIEEEEKKSRAPTP